MRFLGKIGCLVPESVYNKSCKWPHSVQRLAPAERNSQLGYAQAQVASQPVLGRVQRMLLWIVDRKLPLRRLMMVTLFCIPLAAGLGQARPDLNVTITWALRAYTPLALLPLLAGFMRTMLLRWTRTGRSGLSREFYRSANWTTGCLLAALLLAGAGVLIEFLALHGRVIPPETALSLAPRRNALLQASLKALLLIITGSQVFLQPKRAARNLYAASTGAIALLAVESLVCSLTGRPPYGYDLGFWGGLFLLLMPLGFFREVRTR